MSGTATAEHAMTDGAGRRPAPDNTAGTTAMWLGLVSLLLPYGLGLLAAGGAVAAAVVAERHVASGRANRVARENAVLGVIAGAATFVVQGITGAAPLVLALALL